MDLRHRPLASDGPAGNSAFATSTMAAPSSTIKRPATRTLASRSSLALGAPSAQRMSLAGNGTTLSASAAGLGSATDRGTSKRRSLLHGRPTAEPLSGGRADGGLYGRTPQTARSLRWEPADATANNSSRRPSAAQSSGRSSIMPGYGHSSKDSRPVRDRTFQSECQRNIEDFLAQRGVQLALSSKWLVSPTQRDFQTLFRYLVEELMGTGYPWSKKVEDDFIAILRDLRYPAMDGIGKTALTAPGGSNWPHVLAMLNWLVELCKVSRYRTATKGPNHQAEDSWRSQGVASDPLLCAPSALPVNHPQIEERLLWHFTSNMYYEWFHNGSGHFPEAERELEEGYGACRDKVRG